MDVIMQRGTVILVKDRWCHHPTASPTTVQPLGASVRRLSNSDALGERPISINCYVILSLSLIKYTRIEC